MPYISFRHVDNEEQAKKNVEAMHCFLFGCNPLRKELLQSQLCSSTMNTYIVVLSYIGSNFPYLVNNADAERLKELRGV